MYYHFNEDATYLKVIIIDIIRPFYTTLNASLCQIVDNAECYGF